MPTIPVEKLNDSLLNSEEQKIVDMIINKGVLRSSKPKVSKKNSDPVLIGKAAYVWRMVAFHISRNPQHQCMPVTADWDIVGSFDERKEISKQLDVLVDKIVNTVPPTQWHGILRWGSALGMLG